MSNSEIAKWMLVFLCIQLTLGVLQYTNVFGARDVLSLIWSDRKALLGKRSTGSFGNPNLLGAILLFLYCAISFLSSKKSHRVLGLTLTTIGVFHRVSNYPTHIYCDCRISFSVKTVEVVIVCQSRASLWFDGHACFRRFG